MMPCGVVFIIGKGLGMTIPDSKRNELIRLSGSRRTRTNVFTNKRPTKWNPYEVVRPGTCETFTPESAWDYVAELLVAGTRVDQMELKQPDGCVGYVMIVPGSGNEEIYVKLELAGGKVVGRSFHISNKDGNDG